VITRRTILAGSVAAAFAVNAKSRAATQADAAQRIADLEQKNGGRLGVAILETKTGRRVDHRANERFAMCSTFKLLAAACVLSRVDKGGEQLTRRITFGEKDLMHNSPIAKDHITDGMTVGEMCAAMITMSDNTAANQLLASFGGPAAYTSYARSLGDRTTRLDRLEPALNDWKPGDERDTTTPAAMLEDVRKVVIGDALSHASRDQLTAWLIANKTGDKRLRAGVPQGWRVGDKTGTGATDIFNDIAVIWPPDRAPLVVTAYYGGGRGSDDQRNAVLAEVGSIAATLI
jgi:beta-lactamase class A